ncbi:Plasmid stabilization system protein ParE [Arsukibacterium tuosuense]|uniref:Plasmid stabilization system protein ParE n=1 Tax=Arsukibacterium tuosuense TaxID=1323745 RepID=A0A285ILN9_9GAMM|nr:type II toxin-antitoxin system RelE/ParE family toxin [Arsukibacterium tuosuense]SNY48888.1 Plasmid stabilization system protein ParE [Arsukibacterium tuosuense]
MVNAKKRYRLTADAAQDLLNIARYSVKTWGVAQSRAYAAELEETFVSLVDELLPAKPFSESLPDIMVWHNRFHSVYYTYETNEKGIAIIAVLHHKRDSHQTIANRLP